MRAVIASFCVLIRVCAACAQDGGGPDQKFIEQFKSKLAAGYTVKVEYYPNSDRVLSVTPLNAAGKTDGEAEYKVQYGWELYRTIPFTDGLQNGVEKEYAFSDAGGKHERYLSKETPWKAGKIEGVKKLYHPNGKVMTETNYTAGVTDGPSRNYDLSGRLEREATFKNGKRDGPMTEYWTLTGKPKNIIPYKMGKADGLVQEFYDSGKPKKEVTCLNDEFHGIEKHFDEDGALIKTIYWIHDKEVSKKDYDAAAKAP